MEFQQAWWDVIDTVAHLCKQDYVELLADLDQRVQLINRADRVTGNGLIFATEHLMKGTQKFSTTVFHKVFNEFVEQQILRPEYFETKTMDVTKTRHPEGRKVLQTMLMDVWEHREGI